MWFRFRFSTRLAYSLFLIPYSNLIDILILCCCDVMNAFEFDCDVCDVIVVLWKEYDCMMEKVKNSNALTCDCFCFCFCFSFRWSSCCFKLFALSVSVLMLVLVDSTWLHSWMEQKYRVNARNMNAGSFSSGIVYRLSSIVYRLWSGVEISFDTARIHFQQ